VRDALSEEGAESVFSQVSASRRELAASNATRRSNSSHERELRGGRRGGRAVSLGLSGSFIGRASRRIGRSRFRVCAEHSERGTRVTPKSFSSRYDSLLRAPPGTTQRSRAPRVPNNARRKRARDRYGATYAHARSMTRHQGRIGPVRFQWAALLRIDTSPVIDLCSTLLFPAITS